MILKKHYVLLAIAGVMLFPTSCKNKEEQAEPIKQEEQPVINAHETIKLSGTVDKYPVVMVLECAGDTIKGYNYYVRKGRKISTDLQLKGTLKEDGTLELFEWVEKSGRHSSHFIGCFSADEGFQGKFDRQDGKEMMFSFTIDSLSVDATATTSLGFSRTKPKDFAQIVEQLRNAPVSHNWFYDYDADNNLSESSNLSDENSSGSYSDGGSSNIDEYLDSYERCLKKYVAFMKKIDRNNPTATKEAFEYYSELLELSKKADEVKGNMNNAQMKRFIRIQKDFNNAMQKYALN